MYRRTVDLHMHSRYSSDGTFTVRELFQEAEEYRMQAIVIADHDTLETWKDAKKESERTGIQTMSALELSCVDEARMVHILGYGVDTEGEHSLKKIVDEIQASRGGILPQIRRNLEREGFYVDMDEVYSLASPHPPVITNFANAILKDKHNENNEKLRPYRPGGAKSDVPYIRFVKDYLAAGCICYVPEYIVDIYTGIRAIREAGGVPVLAHPGEWFQKKDECKLPEMLRCGLQGVEVYTPYHNEEKESYFKALAGREKLFITAGSDYHDEAKKPGHVMGGVKAADMQMFKELKSLARANKRD